MGKKLNWGSTLGGAASGAAVGTAIAPGIGTAIGAGLGALPGVLSAFGGGDDDLEAQIAEENRQREASKQAQLGYLDQMQAPVVSDLTKKRLAALDQESQPTTLAEDPFYQSDRSTLVQGGQAALSGVQNVQRAQDTSGGFANQGSIHDVYDRLGAQLSGLAQKSVQTKEQKRDAAASLQQQIQDAQISFANAQLQAKAAIEAGDSQAAAAALQQAYAARQQAQQAQNQFSGSLISAGITALGPSVVKGFGAKTTNPTSDTSDPTAGLGGADSDYGLAQGSQLLGPYNQPTWRQLASRLGSR